MTVVMNRQQTIHHNEKSTWLNVVYDIVTTHSIPVRDGVYDIDKYMPEDVRKKHKNSERRYAHIRSALNHHKQRRTLQINSEGTHYERGDEHYQKQQLLELPEPEQQTVVKTRQSTYVNRPIYATH